MNEATGILEVYGVTAGFVAVDAGCKAADVRVESLDKNKPADPTGLPVPVIVVVKFRGSVSAVRSAMEAAAEAARKVSDVISEHIIASPTEDTEKMLKVSGFDKT